MDKKSILWFKNEKKLIRDLSKEDVPNVFMIECKHLQPQRDSAQNRNRTPHVYYDVCYQKDLYCWQGHRGKGQGYEFGN